ncbi:ATP-binding protein, partial [Candidatus Bathyarchaeota archaeon]|nr:ATP-binding protein [Candidatus Bathyarchaeota archaeon]
GKTSVAVNLALSITNVQLLDCDVEEPNAHLLLHPKTIDEEPVYKSIPKVNEDLCDHCGKCAEFCQYNAIFVSKEKTLVFTELCHGCGGCSLVCPQEAISERKHKIGTLKRSSLNDLGLIYGELEVGEPMATPLIREVKRHMDKRRNVILDAPPGASCPVVETVKGSDFCILVTEPTPFGLHDLKIAVQVLEDLRIPFGVVVNRAGIGDKKVYDYCQKKKIPILLEIPYNRRIAELYSRGIPFTLEIPEYQVKFRNLFDDIKRLIR